MDLDPGGSGSRGISWTRECTGLLSHDPRHNIRSWELRVMNHTKQLPRTAGGPSHRRESRDSVRCLLSATMECMVPD